jgi:hypothetical protein
MLLARLKVNGGVQNVARFNTQELRPFAIHKIPQLGRFFAPRVPHDVVSELAFASRIRRRILGSDSSTVFRVIQVGAVALRGDRQVPALRLLLVRVRPGRWILCRGAGELASPEIRVVWRSLAFNTWV